MKHTGIIIGAGIIGSAVAYELSRQGVTDLIVLDPDLEGSLSSTERNAGGVRHLWAQRVNSALSARSIELFAAHAGEIGFQQRGYLWLYSSDNAARGLQVFDHISSLNLGYEKFDRSQIQQRYPFLDKLDGVDFALFGSRDGILNSNALKMFYRQQASAKGARFIDRSRVEGISEGKVSWRKMASGEASERALKEPDFHEGGAANLSTLTADFVIVCAGAWSERLIATATSIQKLTRPIRRQISFFTAENLDLSPYGMIVDTSGVYFHAEGGKILAGVGLPNEPAGFRFDYDHDFFESHIWPALYERSSQMERLKQISGWGGLYSYTPDISGILGRVPGLKQVYECHSFTGHGVMQSYGAAVAITELILAGKFTTLDASQLSRERFSLPSSQWLNENLHI